MTHFKANPDRWQTGQVPARERRKLFTVWVGDAVDDLMVIRNIITFIKYLNLSLFDVQVLIITRAFRNTSVGIDIEGKEKEHTLDCLKHRSSV